MNIEEKNNNRGLKKAKNLFWYSDSEPNEVLIAFCHLVCLPLAIAYDFEDAHWAYVWYSIAVLNDYDAAVAARGNLLSTLQSREIRSLDQRVIRCINSNFSECGD